MSDLNEEILLGFDSNSDEYVRIGKYLVYRDGTIGVVDSDRFVHIEGETDRPYIESHRENPATKAEAERYYDQLMKLKDYAGKTGSIGSRGEDNKVAPGRLFAESDRFSGKEINIKIAGYLVAMVLALVAYVLIAMDDGAPIMDYVPNMIIIVLIPAIVITALERIGAGHPFNIVFTLLGAIIWFFHGIYGIPVGIVLALDFVYCLLR